MNVYLFITFGLIVLMWRQIRGVLLYLKELAPVLLGVSPDNTRGNAAASGIGGGAAALGAALAGAAVKRTKAD